MSFIEAATSGSGGTRSRTSVDIRLRRRGMLASTAPRFSLKRGIRHLWERTRVLADLCFTHRLLGGAILCVRRDDNYSKQNRERNKYTRHYWPISFAAESSFDLHRTAGSMGRPGARISLRPRPWVRQQPSFPLPTTRQRDFGTYGNG